MADANSYEEQRRRQVEENKRKLDELRLHRLSAAVHEAAVKPMPTKELKLRCIRAPPAPTRRSGRVASLPDQPDYRERKAPRGLPQPPDRVYATDEARDYAFSKAEELKNLLSSDHPSFIRPVTHLYATGSWLKIPVQFKRRYLPPCDEMIFLVDEEDGEFQMRYNAKGCGLCTGWNSFAIGQKLADGDSLVFQLVQRTKFKVYIIRASSYYENEHCRRL